MTKEEKRKKYILKIFKDYSDEEILKMYEEKSKEYNKLIIPSRYAKEILENNSNLYYILDYSNFIRNYFKLCECIQYRNLNFKENNDNIEVSIDDIKEQLKENMIEEISIIKENTLEDCYFENNPELEKFYNEYARIFYDLKNDYLLVGTLNLYNLSEGYILPVFKKNNKYYFQQGANGEEIEGFKEILYEDVIKKIKFLNLNSLDTYLNNVKILYKVKDKPIDVCQLKGKIFISNMESMREYIKSFEITNDVMKPKMKKI